MRRDAGIALSLANLCLVGVWAELLPFLYLSKSYPIGAFPCSRDFGAAILNVLCLALAFLAGAQLLGRLAGKRAQTIGSWLLLAILAIPINAVRTHFNTWPERWWSAMSVNQSWLAAVLCLAAGAALLWRWHQPIARGVAVALLTMLPFAFVTMAQGVWGVTTDRACRAEDTRATPLPVIDQLRVVWIVFDELEQRALFERRPASVRLPSFDRFRAEAIYAPEAQAPGHQTELSMPSYISGRTVTRAFVTGENELMVTFEGAPGSEKWGQDADIFSTARRIGFNTGLAGWFLPYCSAIAARLTVCSWQPCTTCGRRVGAFGKTLPESMWYQLTEFAPRYGRRRHIAAYRAIMDRALALAGDPAIGMALVHLPVPHDPWIYDRATGSLTLMNTAADGYFDNLRLADQALGKLRESMEARGTWDRTAVFVTGDHGWRAPTLFGGQVDHRVPFLLKMPGQKTGTTVSRPFGSLAMHRLTLAILERRVTDADGAVAWLNQNAGDRGR